MTEKLAQVPFLDAAAEALKKEGSFSKELTEENFREIMLSVVQNLLTGQDRVQATVSDVSVRMGDKQGTVTGTIKLTAPVKANLKILITLGNAEKQNTLKLVTYEVQGSGGLFSGMAADTARKSIQKHLQNPNEALAKVLGAQLKAKGASLNHADLSFTDKTLSAHLVGETPVSQTVPEAEKKPAPAPQGEWPVATPGSPAEQPGSVETPTKEEKKTPGEYRQHIQGRQREIAQETERKFGKKFRKRVDKLGAWYNAIPKKYKYILSGLLITGSAAVGFGLVSVPALWIMAPAAVRGIFAGAGMFVGVERALHASRDNDKRWLQWLARHRLAVATLAGVLVATPALSKFLPFINEFIESALVPKAVIPGTTKTIGEFIEPVKSVLVPEPVREIFEGSHGAALAVPDATEMHSIASATANPGDGYERMVEHLKHDLMQQYPDASKAPAGIRHILETSAHQLAIENNFYDPKTGVSKIVDIGATLSVDAGGHLEYAAHGAFSAIHEVDVDDVDVHHLTQETLNTLPETQQTALLNEWQLEHPGTVPPFEGDEPIPAHGARYIFDWQATRNIEENVQAAAAESPEIGNTVAKYILNADASPQTIADLSEAAQHLSPDPSLIAEIADRQLQPAAYLLENGHYAIFGGGYEDQLAAAKEAAYRLGHDVILGPESGGGYDTIAPDGSVEHTSPGLFGLRTDPLSPTQAVLKVPLW